MVIRAFTVAAVTGVSCAPALAEGALVLGIPADIAGDGFSYGYRVNAPSPGEARDAAFDACRNNKVAPESARSLCALIGEFRNECMAVAFDPKDGTPGYGFAIAADKATAQDRAMAFCRATAGKGRAEFCKVDAVACDGKTN